MKKFIAIALVLVFALVMVSDVVPELKADIALANEVSTSDIVNVTKDYAAPTALPQNLSEGKSATYYGVSSSNVLATKVGMQVLEKGGNAVDAAIAVAYMLGTVEPYASGIGGGGGMLVYNPETELSWFYDYRDGAGKTISGYYGKVGAPGFVRGMEVIHDKYASLPMSDLMQYAIDAARDGFVVSTSFEERLNTSSSKLNKRTMPQFFNGSLLKAGDVLVQEELATTLESIRDNGSEVFYEGDIAKDIVKSTHLESSDLKRYSVHEYEPVVGEYQGYKIVSAPAPFSGTTLIQMLEIAEAVGLEAYEKDIIGYSNIMGSISSITLNERYHKLADPAYNDLDDSLLDKEHIQSMIDYVKARNIDYVEEDNEHESTTSFSIVDKDGMMVSCTNTLSDFFGTGVYVDGFFMNNTLVTASNSTSSLNYTRRGQRSRSFAMPTLVFGDNGFHLSIGSSGGDRIPQTMFSVLTSFLRGENLQEACDKPRIMVVGRSYFCEQLSNVDTDYRRLLSNEAFTYVGHTSTQFFGSFQAVGYSLTQGSFGAADKRRNGSWDIHVGITDAKKDND